MELWLRAFSVIVLLLPSAVLSQIEEDNERDEIEREFNRLAYGDDFSYHRHGHRHHRHHHPHRRHSAFLFADGPTAVNPAPPPRDNLLPGRHPSVALKLGHMEQAMRDLAGRQQAASMARDTLEKNVKEASVHMNEAVGIKRELARTESQIRGEELKLRKLEDDRLRLDRTHGHLVSSLHHIMEPKIQFAETRLQQREQTLRNLESDAKKWKAEESRFHETSLAMIEQRRQAKQRLDVAEEEEVKIRQEQAAAEKQFDSAKHSVAFNIEGYKVAQAHARAAASKEERGRETVREAKHSLKRLSGIMNMEQRRVDESMAIGKDRVQSRIRQLQGKKETSKVKFEKLREEYRAWQGRQRDFAASVAAKSRVTHEASRAYAEHQQSILDAANAKVAYEAEEGSDWAWDEWPTNHGKRDTDEVELSAI